MTNFTASKVLANCVVMFLLNRINHVLNVKMILHILGVFLWVEGGLFLLCTLVSLYYNEPCYKDFLTCVGLTFLVGAVMVHYGRNAKNFFSRKDAYFIVAVTWFLFSIFGMLPYLFSGEIPTITNAFFETMSGFTTTGATILDDIESLSHGMLFWRSFTQWVGGLGMICFTIALLPVFGQNNQQLYTSEATGVFHDKIHPKISIMTKGIWIIYIILTGILMVLLYLGGMDLFDSICHSFTTTATGGYSTKQDSIAYWNSPFIEYVISIFMLLSCVNFSLYFLLAKGKVKRFFQDGELHWFIGSVAILTLLITASLYFYKGYDLELAFRHAFFQISSIHTSTGFATTDYLTWPHFTWILILYAMLSGGCTGSTGGGLKNLRILILYHNIVNEFKRLLHPNAVLPIRINKNVVPSEKVHAVFTFVVVYFLCMFIGAVLIMFQGMEFEEAISTCVSSLGNVGPAMGDFGPAFSWNNMPDFSKWVLAFLMMIGRLELFSVLVVFTGSFWKDY